MTYEKAELILQQLMAEDSDFYLVRNRDGRSQITDCPVDGQTIIERMPKNAPFHSEPLPVDVEMSRYETGGSLCVVIRR